MIWAKDLEKRYLFANRAFCRQLLNAADTDEPLGKTDMFFALRERDRHPDDPQWHTFGELCQDSDAITLEHADPSVFEEFGNLKGRLTYLDVHKAPFLNERGMVIGTVGSARDITERKQAEAELERHRQHLEELVNSAPPNCWPPKRAPRASSNRAPTASMASMAKPDHLHQPRCLPDARLYRRAGHGPWRARSVPPQPSGWQPLPRGGVPDLPGMAGRDVTRVSATKPTGTPMAIRCR
jgi:hypothetical protein